MVYTVSITSQGQLSLPAKIRKQLGFSRNNKAIISVKNGKVTIEPVIDVLSLKGSLKTHIKAPSQQIRKAFEKHLSETGIK